MKLEYFVILLVVVSLMHGCSSTTSLISSQLSHSSSEICDAKKIDQYLTSDEAVKKVLGLGGVVGAVVGSFVGTSPYELMKGEDICHISGILQKDLDAEPVNKKRTWRNNDTKVTYEYTYIGKEQNDCVSYKLRAYEPKAMFIHNKRYKVCREFPLELNKNSEMIFNRKLLCFSTMI